MKTLLGMVTLGILLLAGTASAAGPTCDRGDTAMGPNCVHESYDRGTVRGYVHSTVYRAHHKVVWSDVGMVQKSTDHYLIVSTLRLGDNGLEWVDVTYAWDGQAYK